MPAPVVTWRPSAQPSSASPWPSSRRSTGAASASTSGCIPSKALLRNAEIAHIITQEKDDFGISGDATMDFGATHKRSRRRRRGQRQGRALPDEEEQDHRDRRLGHADRRRRQAGVDVQDKDGKTSSYTCDNLIIATGAKIRLVPGSTLSERVVTYEEQILTDELPGSIIIGGSGAIGVEFAYVMKNFGVDVTIVEFLDRMVPTEDADVSKELLKQYKKLGVKVLLSTKVEAIEDTGERVKVTVSKDGKRARSSRPTRCSPAIGFAPRVEGYGLDKAGVELTERGAIAIDAPRPHQRRGRLRDRRRDRQADAGPHRRGDGRRRRRDDRRRGDAWRSTST